MSARRGIFLAPFDELVDPNPLAELARGAEENGWDGFFLWDHVDYRAESAAIARSTRDPRTKGPTARTSGVARPVLPLQIDENPDRDLCAPARSAFSCPSQRPQRRARAFGEEIDPRKRARRSPGADRRRRGDRAWRARRAVGGCRRDVGPDGLRVATAAPRRGGGDRWRTS